MEIYLACVFDRHVDPEFRAFCDENEAVLACEKVFRQSMAHAEGVSRDDPPLIGIASWQYAYEGDHAYVLKLHVEGKVESCT